MSFRTPDGNVASGRGPGKIIGTIVRGHIRQALRENKRSYAEIALEYGVSKRTVQRYANAMRSEAKGIE